MFDPKDMSVLIKPSILTHFHSLKINPRLCDPLKIRASLITFRNILFVRIYF